MPARATYQHIQLRLRIASYEAELIARSREKLARSKALLQQKVPTTLLGNGPDLPLLQEASPQVVN